ncbi:serine/threonine protein kinase [Anatilimnocola sp. NA78]|uniref:serine/threonine protein kinase n=1 Tax=Anatilimnocola sp. NA78 TaxID=3415683 RepID=UPI003CE5C50B
MGKTVPKDKNAVEDKMGEKSVNDDLSCNPDIDESNAFGYAILCKKAIVHGGIHGSAAAAPQANQTVDFDSSHPSVVGDFAFDIEGVHTERLIGGKYLLRERIGEGGVGTVWLAEQQTPIQRKVAVKFLRPDKLSARVISRFATEHQTLAHMNHPHIARVFDGGRTGNGLPYLVMEFVPGIPLTAYCDEHRCTIKQRLRLFAKICSAIEHAHQRGVIHRDLKPSNILVAVDNFIAVPKVIDFGLAKTLPGSECPTGASGQTVPGIAVGTPAYMAPEQIITGSLSIDTRSDVYALGVILYELVTGTLPFEIELRGDGWLETYRRILHQDPDWPSRRLQMLKDGIAIASNRQIPLAGLQRMTRGDLDSIILQSLSKQPEQRYESVASLRLDIERFLSNRPTDAHPPSHIYTISKFLKRHSLMVGSVCVILLAICFGLIGTTWGFLRARMAEIETREILAAESEAKDQARRALAALAEAIIESSRIEGSHGPQKEPDLLRQAISLHDAASTRASSQIHTRLRQLPTADRKNSPKEEKLVQVVAVLEHLVAEHPTSLHKLVLTKVRTRLASTLEDMGRVNDAEAEYRKCLLALQQLQIEESNVLAHRLQVAETSERLLQLLAKRRKFEEKRADAIVR